ncbi:MAG: hypothetical protein LBV43_06870 [Prevotella sp.]|nr:hypothetical protein [Prevotella sp.]
MPNTNLKLRQINDLSHIRLSSSGSGDPIYGGELPEIEIVGSGRGSGSGEFEKCPNCSTFYRKGSSCPNCSSSGSTAGSGNEWEWGSGNGNNSSSGSGRKCPLCSSPLTEIPGSMTAICPIHGYILPESSASGSGNSNNPGTWPPSGGGGGSTSGPSSPGNPDPDPNPGDPDNPDNPEPEDPNNPVAPKAKKIFRNAGMSEKT